MKNSIDQMKVTVHLHTILQRQTEQGQLARLETTLIEGAVLSDLLVLLDIQPDLENTLFVVNGRHASLDQTLHDGDEVHLIPAISGGSLMDSLKISSIKIKLRNIIWQSRFLKQDFN